MAMSPWTQDVNTKDVLWWSCANSPLNRGLIGHSTFYEIWKAHNVAIFVSATAVSKIQIWQSITHAVVRLSLVINGKLHESCECCHFRLWHLSATLVALCELYTFGSFILLFIYLFLNNATSYSKAYFRLPRWKKAKISSLCIYIVRGEKWWKALRKYSCVCSIVHNENAISEHYEVSAFLLLFMIWLRQIMIG